MKLEGKVAIVTGAGGAGVGGLGVVYARALAAEGAAVVVSDIDGEAAIRTAEDIASSGAQTIGVRCDVALETDIEAMVQAATSAFGGVDILVNNAGLARGKWSDALPLSKDEWLEILAVNTVAPIMCAKACAASMRSRGGGVVVNQSSNGALMDAGAYTVSKLALNGVTRVLADEFADDNIRVNGIAPGMMTAKLPEQQVKTLLARQTVRRQGQPEDLVGLLLYLCSEESSFMNGQTVVIDGGMARSPKN
ncbi:SDR family NAD(P)-dependent oxidoreductase [Candidatus Poriferisocius sp.]|uniref:SDR family NAD(P)-dependent oxidoreductase n=1 Tax=Candidatus Poriferisocius sp. TaxID=3101276 RepID=UPI003B026CFA